MFFDGCFWQEDFYNQLGHLFVFQSESSPSIMLLLGLTAAVLSQPGHGGCGVENMKGAWIVENANHSVSAPSSVEGETSQRQVCVHAGTLCVAREVWRAVPVALLFGQIPPW